MDVDLTLLQVEAMPEDSVSGYDETASTVTSASQ